MNKPALASYPIHPLLHTRWSPRSFLSQSVGKEKLQRLFEAARWAPSSYNDQPWRFIIGQKEEDETWSKIFETLAEFNQKWAVLAPVLVMSIGKKVSDKTQKPNAKYQYDVGQSVAYLTFQATEEGLFAHQMGGFDAVKAKDLFSIPDEYEPITVIAVGYKGESELLTDPDLAKSEKLPRQRNELTSTVFQSNFGTPSDLF